MGDIPYSNGTNNGNGNANGNGVNGKGHSVLNGYRKSCWYEEEIEENLRWSFALNSILHTGATPFQDIALLDTKPFGKALVIDGKLQSAETDEFIYHECLVHPPLLHHPKYLNSLFHINKIYVVSPRFIYIYILDFESNNVNISVIDVNFSPKSIFIMGGGEGSTARELLRHRTVEKVVMCDIDEEVVGFCKSYLIVNSEAFCDPRLELIINDARAELENREEQYDVIIGDLADPIEGGPCYKLYTKSFYELIVKPRLSKEGIFVTQAGPAGIFSHTEVFSCIYNTLRQVFRYVVPYSAHIPSYADIWGWIMASDTPIELSADELDLRIKQRITGENRYLDGKTFSSASTLSKAVRKSMVNETHVYTEGTARFIYGHGHGSAYKLD
ncbi:hypothetical protein DVH24_013301 [Malus domestica]|uniref:thermospermine synthase n=1 Tax=Malus domestica TaxID=3750 RepID=A0A498HLZ8_MALDO|nr:hypothetical protein DVH24_013301 [Malus domestica]